jgi:hypothetical protein
MMEYLDGGKTSTFNSSLVISSSNEWCENHITFFECYNDILLTKFDLLFFFFFFTGKDEWSMNVSLCGMVCFITQFKWIVPLLGIT